MTLCATGGALGGHVHVLVDRPLPEPDEERPPPIVSTLNRDAFGVRLGAMAHACVTMRSFRCVHDSRAPGFVWPLTNRAAAPLGDAKRPRFVKGKEGSVTDRGPNLVYMQNRHYDPDRPNKYTHPT